MTRFSTVKVSEMASPQLSDCPVHLAVGPLNQRPVMTEDYGNSPKSARLRDLRRLTRVGRISYPSQVAKAGPTTPKHLGLQIWATRCPGLIPMLELERRRNIYLPDQWNNFFVMVGSGAAALAGLIFVAMSIKHEIIIQNTTHKNRAINMLTG